MIFLKETNEIKDVCVTEEDTKLFSYTNYDFLVEEIKTQIEEKISNKTNYGDLGYNDVNNPYGLKLSSIAFKYSNPRIIENKLYLDLKILDTPKGKFMSSLISDFDNSKLFRTVLTGIGTLEEDKSISDYKLITVNFVWKNETLPLS